MFGNVKPGHVIQSIDAWSIYQVPLNMHAEHLDELVVRHLQMNNFAQPDMRAWNAFLEKLKKPKSEVDIALVGKYVELQDAYKSILESFVHAGAANECKVNVHTVHSEHLNDDNAAELLGRADGILVAPDSASAASKARSRRPNTPGSTTCPSSEYAWACRCAWSSSQDTCSAGTTPARLRSRPRPNIP